MNDFLTKLAQEGATEPVEEGVVNRVLDWLKARGQEAMAWPGERWEVLRAAFANNPILASALAVLGPTALLGGGYGAYRGAKDRSLLRSALFGALSGAGGGALYRLLNAPGAELALGNTWLPMAIGALIGAGGGLGAYGLGRLFG